MPYEYSSSKKLEDLSEESNGSFMSEVGEGVDVAMGCGGCLAVGGGCLVVSVVMAAGTVYGIYQLVQYFN